MSPLLGCSESKSWLYLSRSAGFMLQSLSGSSGAGDGAAGRPGATLGATFGSSPYIHI